MLAATCLLFAGFLVSPGFGDSWFDVDGRRSYLSGFATLWFLIIYFPYEVAKLSDWALCIALVLSALLAFLSLPVLHFTRLVERPRLNQALRLVFFLGACGFAGLLWSTRVRSHEFGAYLWLLAAMTAVEYLVVSQARPGIPNQVP